MAALRRVADMAVARGQVMNVEDVMLAGHSGSRRRSRQHGRQQGNPTKRVHSRSPSPSGTRGQMLGSQVPSHNASSQAGREMQNLPVRNRTNGMGGI